MRVKNTEGGRNSPFYDNYMRVTKLLGSTLAP